MLYYSFVSLDLFSGQTQKVLLLCQRVDVKGSHLLTVSYIFFLFAVLCDEFTGGLRLPQQNWHKLFFYGGTGTLLYVKPLNRSCSISEYLFPHRRRNNGFRKGIWTVKRSPSWGSYAADAHFHQLGTPWDNNNVQSGQIYGCDNTSVRRWETCYFFTRNLPVSQFHV